ncbi:hypothetical protein EMN47_18905 [Prolixibacteraceae bacterium JC049]|nr:hypothetical protein [Prolixibacteraceae bacterium JC049]
MGRIYRWSILCVVFLFGALATGYAQENVHIKFIKPDVEVSESLLSFNVLYFENKTDQSQRVKVKLIVPQGWRSMTFLPKQVLIKPKETKRIPVRVKAPRNINAEKEYFIKADVASGEVTKQLSYQAKVAPKHKWNVFIGSDISYFTSEKLESNLEVNLVNTGNITEVFDVWLSLTRELQFGEQFRERQRIKLGAQKDTVFKVPVMVRKDYWYDSFNNANLKIHINTKNGKKEKVIYLKKLNSEYDYFEESDLKTEHEAGVVTRYYDGADAPQVGIYARGRPELSEKANLEYSISSQNIMNKQNLLQNSEINIGYRTDNWRTGVGASSSDLGVNLYKKHSIYSDYSWLLSKKHIIHTFGNLGYVDKGYGAALGYEYKGSYLSTKNSAAFNDNLSDKIKTKSLSTNTYLNLWGNNVSYSAKWSNSNSAAIGQSSLYDHQLNYRLVLGGGLDFSVNSNYRKTDDALKLDENNTLRFNSGLSLGKGWYMNAFYTLSKVGSTDKKNSVDRKVENQLYQFQLSAPAGKKVRFGLGAQMSENKLFLEDSESKSKTFSGQANMSWRMKRFQYRADVNYGIKKSNEGNKKTMKVRSKMNYEAGKDKKLSLNVDYSTGESATLYSKSDQKKLLASLQYAQTFMQEKLKVAAAANYNYQEGNSYNGIGGSAKVETVFKHNIKIRVEANIRKRQNKGVGLASVEVGVSKGFNSFSGKKSYHNLTIYYFKDKNANGKMDDDEEPIDNVYTNISRNGSLNRNSVKRSKQFMNTTLISTEKGTVECKHLANGEYGITYRALKNLDGYFNFDGAHRAVMLVEDQEVFVPYVMAAKIFGVLTVKKSNFSAAGLVDLANIRITAVDEQGREYSGLTDRLGNYTVYVPKNRKYKLTLRNVFGGKFQIKNNNRMVEMTDVDKNKQDFLVTEKRRKINFRRK